MFDEEESKFTSFYFIVVNDSSINSFDFPASSGFGYIFFSTCRIGSSLY